MAARPEPGQHLAKRIELAVGRRRVVLVGSGQVGAHPVKEQAVGIAERVGDRERFPLTDAQKSANVALVRHLRARFPGITHLIGHHEYLAFEAHPYFREREPDYRTRKGDPGPAFMRDVRAELSDLNLAGPPAP